MPTREKSALQPSQRMRVAYLLATVGGYLDAYTYFERGGVFANAQTGNIVKLGIALANGARDRYLLYLLPIGSFVLGLLVSLSIDCVLERRGVRLVRRTVLAIEALGLAVVGLMPLGEWWDTPANCIVSFLAAMQYETFTTFRGDAIVTTMSTGNLRKMVDSFFRGAMTHNRGRFWAPGRVTFWGAPPSCLPWPCWWLPSASSPCSGVCRGIDSLRQADGLSGRRHRMPPRLCYRRSKARRGSLSSCT